MLPFEKVSRSWGFFKTKQHFFSLFVTTVSLPKWLDYVLSLTKLLNGSLMSSLQAALWNSLVLLCCSAVFTFCWYLTVELGPSVWKLLFSCPFHCQQTCQQQWQSGETLPWCETSIQHRRWRRIWYWYSRRFSSYLDWLI